MKVLSKSDFGKCENAFPSHLPSQLSQNNFSCVTWPLIPKRKRTFRNNFQKRKSTFRKEKVVGKVTFYHLKSRIIAKARNKSYQTLLEKLFKSYHKLSKIVTKIWKKLQKRKGAKIIMKHEKPNQRLCVDIFNNIIASFTRIKQILCIAGPVGGRDKTPCQFSQKLCTFWFWGGPGPCPPLQILPYT